MDAKPIFQYAYLVADVETASHAWAETVGAGPFFVTPHHRADWFRYRGEPVEADVTYAFGYSGDVQIQLVQQHDDTPSIYRDMFPTGFGHHHVARLVDEYETERDRLAAGGFALACELRANDISACYFDTRSSIGAYTELHSSTARIRATFARWRAAHAAWNRRDAPLRYHASGT
jgi:hypothetical protein